MEINQGNPDAKLLGDHYNDQISVKEILFNYFLEVYEVEEILDSRLMFYNDYDNNNYPEVFRRDFILWLWLIETYFLSSFRHIYRNWDECKRNYIENYES